MDECAACPAGTFYEDSSRTCVSCNAGREDENPNFVSPAASLSVAACTCKAGDFWNRALDRCDPCTPVYSFCPGGLDLPLVHEGSYGVYDGPATGIGGGADTEQEQRKRGEYVAPGEGKAFSKLSIWNCLNDEQCPGETITRAGIDGEVTRKDVRWPATDLESSGSGCLADSKREGIACARCKAGHYGDGEDCATCDEANALNGIFIVLLPVIVHLIYLIATGQAARRATQAFILASTFGLGMTFCQTIAVMSTFKIQWPLNLHWLFTFANIFMFDLQGITLGCLYGDSFNSKYWVSVMMPVFFMVAVALAYALSNLVVAKTSYAAHTMQLNRTLSMIGMFCSALYISLVKVVLVFFECVPNPAAEDTLGKYKDVECGSEDHDGALGPMLIGLILYVIGFFGLTAWANHVWPTKHKNADFKMRFEFLTARWRLKVWYYGQFVMLRNLLVATVGSMTPEPTLQLTILVALMVLYMLGAATYQPWKAKELNYVDSAVSFLVILIGTFGVVFLTLDTETDLYARFGQTETAADKQKKLEDVAGVVLGIVCIFCGVFIATIIWAMYWCLPSQRLLALKKHHAAVDSVVALLNKVHDADFVDNVQNVLLAGTDYDRRGFQAALDLIGETKAEYGEKVPRAPTWTESKTSEQPATVSA